jgi:phosphohistidine phosphatase
MKILIVRHARAEERRLLGLLRKDAARPLTPEGRKDMAKAAKGLKQLVSDLRVLATSPLVRAKQTAQILAERYDTEVTEVTELSPGADPDKLLAWLRKQPLEAIVALVGHEPDLGALASWFLTGRKESFVQFKKGAACLIDFAEAGPAPGRGRLEWLIQPGALRKLV